MKKVTAIILGTVLMVSTVFTGCETVKNTSNQQRGVAIGAVGGAKDPVPFTSCSICALPASFAGT
jgi:hypothetical protein